MNQSELLTITHNLLEAQEKSCVQGAIGFGFASHRSENLSEIFYLITNQRNRNRGTAFDSHLKTPL